MMKQIFKIILLSIFVVQPLFAQELSVVLVGKVTDSFNNPVLQAEVGIWGIGSTYTDTNGNYRLEGLSPGAYSRVRIIPPQDTNLIPLVPELTSLYLYLYSGTNTVDFTLPIGGIFTGVVKDELNNPITNAKLEARHLLTNYPPTGITDSEGKYTIKGLITGDYRLTVEPPKDLNLGDLVISGVSVTQGATTTQDIILPSCGTITGQITDHEGEPAVGVEVKAISADTYLQKSVTTDVEGRYVLNNLTRGTYNLELKPPYPLLNIGPPNIDPPIIIVPPLTPGTLTYLPSISTIPEVKSGKIEEIIISLYSESNLTQLVESIKVIPATTTYKNIVLVNWVKIKGCVKDISGNPLPMVEIIHQKYAVMNESIEGITIPCFSVSTITNTLGEYSIPWLEPGSYRLKITPPTGLNLVKKELILTNLSPGTTTIQDIVLEYGGIITGSIKDEYDNPVVNASIYVSDYSTITDPYGNYIVKGISSGTHLMTIKPYGTVNLLPKEVCISISKPGTITQNVILTQGGILKGKIEDEFGIPIGNAIVRTENSPVYKSTQTDANGLYQIEGLPSGDYWIEVIAGQDKNLLRFNISGVTVKIGSTTIQDITLKSGATVLGKITDTTGNPVINADISIRGLSYDWYSTRTDNNGEYAFRQLIGGIYEVNINPPPPDGLLSQRVIIQINKGTTTAYNFILSKGKVISGLIKDDKDKPIIGAKIKVRMIYSPYDSYEVTTNFYGSYTINGLSPGVYSLSITPPQILNLLPVEIGAIEINTDVIQDITLSKGGMLTGTLKDTYNRPIPNGEVYLGDKSTMTGLAGDYKFVGLSPMTYTLKIILPRVLDLGNLYIKDIKITQGRITTQNIILPLHAVGNISGRVTDSDGKGIYWAVINIWLDQEPTLKGGITDKDGYFTIGRLWEGTYTMKVRFPNGDVQVIEGITIIPGSITYRNITFTNWGRIKGTVKDEKGNPVTKAKIYLEGNPSVTTDVAGAYEITGIRGENLYKLFVTPPQGENLLEQEIKVYVPKGTVTIQNFILETGGVITGVVKDELGNVIKDAKVSRWAEAVEETAPKKESETVIEESAEEIHKEEMKISQAEIKKAISSDAYTNFDGRYTIIGLPSGTYTLRVEPPNKELAVKEITQIAVVKNSTTTCNITLEQGGVITGYVLDELNQPISQVNIFVPGSPPIRVTTDSTGKYILQGLPSGRYMIEVYFWSRISYLRYTISDILVTSGTTIIQNIILNKSGIISGNVVDTSGNPIINARVSVWGKIDQKSQGDTHTDSTGKYIIDNLLAEVNYNLEIYPPEGINLVKQRLENIFIKSGTITILNICMSPGSIITGTVTDTEGNPVNEVRVYAGGNSGYSDTNGNYTIIGLSPGIYTIEATPPYNNRNLARYRSGNVRVIQGSITIHNIILPVAGTLTGYIKDKNGNPVPNAGITLSTNFWGTGIQTQIDGKYTFYNLPPGMYFFYINPPENSLLVGKSIKDIEIISGTTIIKDVILDTGGIIIGIVTDTNLNPVANIPVSASARGGDVYRFTDTDIKGRYTLYNLPPGTYTITASPPVDINLIQQSYQNIIVNIGATTTQNFVLLSGGIIRGTVTDESGNLIGNAWIIIRESNISKDTKTNFNGQYIIKGLPTGIYQIEVIPEQESPYFRKKISGVVIIVGQITEQTFILSRGGSISGEIVDKTNDGIEKIFCVFAISAGKRLTIYNFGDVMDEVKVAITDLPAGHYSLTPILSGNYDLYWYVISQSSISMAGVTFFKAYSNLVIGTDTFITNHTITLQPIRGGICGTATIPQDYAGPMIYLTNLEDEVAGFACLNENGRYEISYLYPGTYSIWGETWGNWVKIKGDIIVEEGKMTMANFTFPSPPYGTITGLVKDINGKPISEAIIILIRDKGRNVIATATTNNNGIFSFFPVFPRYHHRLKVFKIGYMAQIIPQIYVDANEIRIINFTLQLGDGITSVIYGYEENNILLENKVRLIIPPNSISSNEESISIVKLRDDELPPILSSGINLKPTGLAYDFKPDNLKFNHPATITLFYPESGLNEDKLAVFYYNGIKWVYAGGNVNKEERTITFQTNHLSLYAIMEYTSLMNLNKVICYPNPFYPDKDGQCRIVGIPVDAHDVKVIIYNIAGELVKVFDQDEIKEGVDCKFVEWDGTNEYNYKVAYGIYIYVVKSETGVQQGKIALIR